MANTAKVEGVDEITNANAMRKDLESKGSIGLSFRLINNVRDGTREHRGSRSNSLRAIGAVPEKALKGDARSHQATYIIYVIGAESTLTQSIAWVNHDQ
jgi:hypothetical protein